MGSTHNIKTSKFKQWQRFLFYCCCSLHCLFSETINCDNNWSESVCHKQTLFCSDNSTDCFFNCRGDGSCEETVFHCQPKRECTVNCFNANSCRGSIPSAIVHCPQNGDCRINCNGLSSCDRMKINCFNSVNCTISANGRYALSDSFTHCPSQSVNSQCSVHCNNLSSCNFAHFDAQNSSFLNIECADNLSACKNIQIKCPQHINGSKRCQLIGDEGTIQNQLKIYAKNSWNDIDLTRYLAQTAISDTFNLRMLCDTDYDEQCIISSIAWNCQSNQSKCFRHGIVEFPTSVPTQSPTNNSSKESLLRWAPIIGIIVGVFLFFLAVFFGYFVCLKQTKEYDAIHQTKDPDADLMDNDESEQRMFKQTNVPKNRARKSMDIEMNDGFHIVNEYSDVSKIGNGLLPISEQTLLKQRTVSKTNIESIQEEEEEQNEQK